MRTCLDTGFRRYDPSLIEFPKGIGVGPLHVKPYLNHIPRSDLIIPVNDFNKTLALAIIPAMATDIIIIPGYIAFYETTRKVGMDAAGAGNNV